MKKYSTGDYFDGKVSVSRFIQLTCDVCKNVYEYEYVPSYPIQFIFKSMRKYGWRLGKNCICPKCNRK